MKFLSHDFCLYKIINYYRNSMKHYDDNKLDNI